MADWIKYNPTSKLWELSTNDGGSFSTLDVDAAQITSGEFATARIPGLDAAKIISGLLATARLGSGTADATTFLRGDQSWQEIENVEYEEGNWSPTIIGSTSGVASGYTTQQGYYVKINSLVFGGFYIQLSNKGTIAGNAMIGGLPYVAKNGSNFRSGFFIPYFTNLSSASVGYVSALLGQNSASGSIFYNNGSSLAMLNMPVSLIANTTFFMGFTVYESEL